MERNKASKRFRIIIFVLTALTVAFIWIHSMFPASLSSMESRGILGMISSFFGLFGLEGAVTEHLVRKLAHFSEFAVLGSLLLSCAYCFDRLCPYRYVFQVLFAGLICAVTDETIQLGTEGRAGMITDVWIDFGGVVFGALLMTGVYTLYKKRGRIR